MPARSFVPLQMRPSVHPIDANVQRVALSFNRSLLHVLPPDPMLTLTVKGERRQSWGFHKS